jgi:hypothetical protein
VRPRPLPKPPHNTPILPQRPSSSSQQPPSPCTLTRTATGFNFDWKGGNLIANKKKIKEIEQVKKSCKESVSVGTTHALEILGESTCVHPVCPLLERVGTSQSVQMSQGFLCPQHSEPIEEGMPPPPQHEDVERPQGEPPQSWSIACRMGVTSDLDSAEQHPAAREVIPAQAGESRVEVWSSKKHSRASQSSKTRASTRSMQSTTSKHVERMPERNKILLREPIWLTLLPIPSEEISRVSTGLRVYLGQVMSSGTRLPPRHRRVTPTQAGTRVLTHLLRLVRSDQTMRKTATTMTGEPIM